MRKIFLEYVQVLNSYKLLSKYSTNNFDLQNLWLSFDRTNDWMRIDIENGLVEIWDSTDIKQRKWDFLNQSQEYRLYEEAYRKYCKKIWQEIPVIKITEQNYNEVLQQWKEAHQEKKNYMIISIDDVGWIRIETKDEWSSQDLQEIEQEHQKFLVQYQKWEAYAPFAYKTNEIWQSPADDVYFSDYLTEEEMVWKKKKR